MSIISYISLRVVEVIGFLALLSGCSVGQNTEQIFPYELRIENRLMTPIAYCEGFEVSNCPHVVQVGRSERQIFMSHVANRSDDEKFEAFDRQKIKVCGNLVDFKLIRAVSPVIKRDKDHFEIIIDKAVSDVFCK